MAITRTQIARQLYRKGGDTMGGPNDKSKNRGPANSPFSSGFQGAKQASTPTRSRIQEDRQKDFQQNPDKYKTNVRGEGEGSNILNVINPFSKDRRKLQYNASMLIPGQKARSAKMQRAYKKYLESMGITPPDTLTGEDEDLAEFFVENAFDKPVAADAMLQTPKSYGEFIAENFGAPGVMMSGNVGGLEKFVKTRDADGKPLTYGYTERRGDGDGAMSDYERRLLELERALKAQTAATTPTPTVFQPNFRVMADGGMTEDAPVEGGIMDLESGRQMYFLGKLVKKATRAVKKIVKSPIGKAALFAGLGAYGLGKGPFAKIAGSGFLKSGSPLMTKLFKEGTIGSGLTGTGMLALGGGLTLAPFLFGDEEEEQQPMYQGADLPNPVNYYLSGNFPMNRRLVADGGLMRVNYQEGGDAEPVAKKTMPLLDMDGKEKDYRETGGFVDMGRMERADDVPARLSKNEFVFTADAVRNAGEGDIDKGAEVMYNMMKNLEAGGEVSEESQGLEGAREMFQTSQRLEEVL